MSVLSVLMITKTMKIRGCGGDIMKNLYKLIEVGDDVSVFVVGDIHGCYDLLMSKLDEIGFNKKTDLLISVGD